METTSIMHIVKCKNPECNNKIRLSEGRFTGGVNDSGGIILKCGACGAVIACQIKNTQDLSGVISGGTKCCVWLDDFPVHYEKEYGVTQDDVVKSERLVVLGSTKPPKTEWRPSDRPVYGMDTINFEELSANQLISVKELVEKKYMGYLHYYLKRGYAENSFVFLEYSNAGKKFQSVFAKQIDSPDDLNTNNLYLIHHSKVDLDEQVDGIYSKSQCLEFLERFLNRWRYVANEVLLVVPFIGYHYENSSKQVVELWDWLEMNMDVKKSRLVTRKGTFDLLKKAQDRTGVSFDFLLDWGLLEPLVDSVSSGDMPFYQRSHAKYYVGVFDEYVEVLAGSFNIHTGPSFENISYRRYDKEFFKNRFLHMFKDFSYVLPQEKEYVHYMVVGSGKEENSCANIDEVIKLFQQ